MQSSLNNDAICCKFYYHFTTQIEMSFLQKKYSTVHGFQDFQLIQQTVGWLFRTTTVNCPADCIFSLSSQFTQECSQNEHYSLARNSKQQQQQIVT